MKQAASFLLAIRIHAGRSGNLLQTYTLHDGPNDRDTTRFCRKSINLIGAISNIAKKALNRICASDISVHDAWKLIKRQKMLFIFAQAPYRFWIALTVFHFE